MALTGTRGENSSELIELSGILLQPVIRSIYIWTKNSRLKSEPKDGGTIIWRLNLIHLKNNIELIDNNDPLEKTVQDLRRFCTSISNSSF